MYIVGRYDELHDLQVCTYTLDGASKLLTSIAVDFENRCRLHDNDATVAFDDACGVEEPNPD